MKYTLLLFVLCLLAHWGFAQTSTTLEGIILNQKTSERVSTVSITNLAHPAMAASSNTGTFSIKASLGDTLLFTKEGYTSNKIAVGMQQSIVVFLIPITQLSTVVVKDKSNRQEQNDVMDTYRSKGIYYNGKPPALSVLASPVTGLYELFGKGPKQARRFANFMKNENRQLEISRRYNKDLVKRITKLPDDELQTFMDNYQPPYPEVMKWNDYDIIQFINKSLASYQANKNLEPLPKLTP